MTTNKRYYVQKILLIATLFTNTSSYAVDCELNGLGYENLNEKQAAELQKSGAQCSRSREKSNPNNLKFGDLGFVIFEGRKVSYLDFASENGQVLNGKEVEIYGYTNFFRESSAQYGGSRFDFEMFAGDFLKSSKTVSQTDPKIPVILFKEVNQSHLYIDPEGLMGNFFKTNEYQPCCVLLEEHPKWQELMSESRSLFYGKSCGVIMLDFESPVMSNIFKLKKENSSLIPGMQKSCLEKTEIELRKIQSFKKDRKQSTQELDVNLKLLRKKNFKSLTIAINGKAFIRLKGLVQFTGGANCLQQSCWFIKSESVDLVDN